VPPDSDLHFVLTDFGKAKLLLGNNALAERYLTAGGGTYRYVFPPLREYLRKNKVPVDFFTNHGCQCDIYSLGVVLRDVFPKVPALHLPFEQPSSWDYLVNDMMWYEGSGHRQLINQHNTTTLLKSIDKLTGEGQSRSVMQGSSPAWGKVLRLQGQLSVPFPPDVQDLVDTPEFQRLRGVAQLGLSSLVYPSATHSRFSHSLGAYYYACQYLEALKRHPAFGYLYDECEIHAAQLASILHDIGHYPYAHYFEEMGGRLRVGVGHEALGRLLLAGSLTYHDFLRSELARRFYRESDLEMLQEKRDARSLGVQVSAIDPTGLIVRVLEGSGRFEALKLVIDSPIDCDKLDYLRRDGTATGVPYAAAIDTSRFLSALTLDDQQPGRFGLALTAKGKSAIESIVSARYTLFSEVYWHKTARAAAAMIKDAFFLAQENLSQEEFHLAAVGLNDKEFLLWLASKINERRAAYDLLIGSLCLTNRRLIYKRIKTYPSVWEEPKKKRLHQRFTIDLGRHYDQVARFRGFLVDNLNKCGANKKNWERVLDHHILIDVPSLEMDQQGTVAIKYPPSVEGRVFYSLQAVSQLSKAIDESFAAHVKKVRIFCHPALAAQVVGVGGDLDDAIDQAWLKFGDPLTRRS
jgi:HD superfamily phosphohydrolase